MVRSKYANERGMKAGASIAACSSSLRCPARVVAAFPCVGTPVIMKIPGCQHGGDPIGTIITVISEMTGSIVDQLNDPAAFSLSSLSLFFSFSPSLSLCLSTTFHLSIFTRGRNRCGANEAPPASGRVRGRVWRSAPSAAVAEDGR